MSAARERLAGRALLQAPDVAWPTLLLFAASTAAWTASVVLGARGALPLGAALALSTLAAFAAFTPMHDAAHRSLARSRMLNELVGRVGAVILAGPFPSFRFVHLEHHRNTNDPAADPDFWSGMGPAWLRPLRWMSQDLHYYAFIGARWRSRPVAERVEVAGVVAAAVALAVAAAATGHAALLLACWLVPSRLALLLLAFSFDYLPHRPHAVTAREDELKATHVFSDAVLTPVFLYQNFHLIHHLYPGVPFYRYARVWRAQREVLLARGASERRLFGRGEAGRVSSP